MSENEVNQHFVGLVLSLHSSAWIHLGKVTNPATGKSERNLDAAREVIDLLGALEEKSRGNRASDEEHLMNQVLTELRMNYVDELERSKKEGEAADGGDAAEAEAAPETSEGAEASAAAGPSEAGSDDSKPGDAKAEETRATKQEP